MYHRLDPSQQLQVLVSFYSSGWYIAKANEIKTIGKGSNHLPPFLVPYGPFVHNFLLTSHPKSCGNVFFLNYKHTYQKHHILKIKSCVNLERTNNIW
jgi:hypothetical protein